MGRSEEERGNGPFYAYLSSLNTILLLSEVVRDALFSRGAEKFSLQATYHTGQDRHGVTCTART